MAARAGAWPTRARSNADDFLADEVLGALAGDLEITAGRSSRPWTTGQYCPPSGCVQLSRRLVWTFEADVTSFERKKYAHLPHDANKAMNLNAYLGLMGRRVQQIETQLGTVLRDSDGPDALDIPDSDYVLTLDADSVLLREYCLRLVHQLELPGNERIAVIQTPYSAFRGASTRLERIAGATTDIQHLVHQGLTYYDATFWVGANAVIRKVALDDIVEVSYVGGQEVRRYVQDRTVIEDTESSIDLVAAGWTLSNYPERLSYSATPTDFGSLSVQRARWANGGLLIAPKFWRLIRRRRKEGNRVPKAAIFAALQLHGVDRLGEPRPGLPAGLPVRQQAAEPDPRWPRRRPTSSRCRRTCTGWATSAPTSSGSTRSTSSCSRVNLAGTLKSLQQAAAKSKIAFARTPKVKDRTAVPALYILRGLPHRGVRLRDPRQRHQLAELEQRGLRRLQRFAHPVRDHRLHRHAQLDRRRGARHGALGPGARQGPEGGRRATAATGPATASWNSILYFGPDASESIERSRIPVTQAPPPRRGDTRAHERS